MKLLLLTFIRLYRWLLSPMLGTHCRFTPGCAAYAQEALQLHGAWNGTQLAAKRLLRCHPFAASGFDPVPSPSPDKK